MKKKYLKARLNQDGWNNIFNAREEALIESICEIVTAEQKKKRSYFLAQAKDGLMFFKDGNLSLEETLNGFSKLLK